MLHVALFEPEIPPNTGNIIRLCANAGAQLHLIKPLAFALDDKKLRRAGLDYHEFASLQIHSHIEAFFDWCEARPVYACTTKARQHHHRPAYQDESVLLFGPESRGLPAEVLSRFEAERQIRIPMRPDSRSLNLSNAAAIILYEAWRQLDYAGASITD